MQSLALFRGLQTVFIAQIEKGAEPFELPLVISVRSFFALQPFQVTNMIKSLKVVRSSYHADDPSKLNSCSTELEGLREMQSDGEGEEKVGATFYNIC